MHSPTRTHTNNAHHPHITHTHSSCLPPLSTHPNSFPVASSCTHTSPSVDPYLLLWPSLLLGIKGDGPRTTEQLERNGGPSWHIPQTDRVSTFTMKPLLILSYANTLSSSCLLRLWLIGRNQGKEQPPTQKNSRLNVYFLRKVKKGMWQMREEGCEKAGIRLQSKQSELKLI